LQFVWHWAINIIEAFYYFILNEGGQLKHIRARAPREEGRLSGRCRSLAGRGGSSSGFGSKGPFWPPSRPPPSTFTVASG